jgi:hypothetical protein
MTDDRQVVAYRQDGHPLTAEDVARMRNRVHQADSGMPVVGTPRFSTDGRLYSRDELVKVFRNLWGLHMTSYDVGVWLRSEKLTPVEYAPFPPTPDVSEVFDHRERMRMINEHEERRSTTAKSRERYDINGARMPVPQAARPSMNDTPAERQRKADYINGL